jgi:hypothetical protein
MDTIEAFEDSLKLEVATSQIRGSRQAVEIIDFEGGCSICAHESVVGLTPRATSVALTAVFQMIHLTPRSSRTTGRPMVVVWHDAG